MISARHYNAIRKNEISLIVEGHSHFVNGDTGNNDLCVAVSTLIIELTVAMDNEGLTPEDVEDGKFTARIVNPSDKIRHTMASIVDTLKWLRSTHKYREDIEVKDFTIK